MLAQGAKYQKRASFTNDTLFINYIGGADYSTLTRVQSQKRNWIHRTGVNKAKLDCSTTGILQEYGEYGKYGLGYNCIIQTRVQLGISEYSTIAQYWL